MFLACGVGAFGVGVFHLFTHAFFKALLFLGSGSVIHALSGEQDMRKMGGLRRKIPWTFGTFADRHRSPSRASRPWPASSARTRSWPGRSRAGRQRPLRRRPPHRAADRVLHDAPAVPDVLRPLPRGTTRPSTTSTSRPGRCWSRWCSWPSAPPWAASSTSRTSSQPVFRLRGGARRPPRGLAAHRWPRPSPSLGIVARLLPLRRVPRRSRRGSTASARGVRARARGQVRLRRRSTTGSRAASWSAAARTCSGSGVDAAPDRRRRERAWRRWRRGLAQSARTLADRAACAATPS